MLQNRIATVYLALGRRQAAIRHYTAALEVEDTALNRAARGTVYSLELQCAPAVEDARAALTMEPVTGNGIHTDVQANAILAVCYTQQGDYLRALQHADAALEITGEYRHRLDDLDTLSLARDSLQAVVDGDMWPEDLFFPPALTHYEAGEQLFVEGDYEAAIVRFQDARETHGTASGAIQTQIAASHGALGRHEQAIRHYTDAVAIRDDAHHRVSRGNEYLFNEKCDEANADAEAALEKKTYAEPGYHTGAEAHWILGSCLVLAMDEEGALPHLKQAMNLARANQYPFELVSLFSETHDGVKLAVETGLIISVNNENARWLQYGLPETAASLVQLPWVKDGLAPEEQRVLENLVQLMADGTPFEGPVPPDSPVLAIPDMPFLRSMEPGAAEAVISLGNIAVEDRAALDAILEHPTLAGGITDQWTPVIALLWGVHQQNAPLVENLLDPSQVRLESRTVRLPQTGTLELRIVRPGPGGNPNTMDLMEEAVRGVESFMDLPMPTQMVAVLFADSVIPGYDGTNFGSGIAILPEHEEDQDGLRNIMAHEVAHYYWVGNRDWVDEGMSELIAAHHRRQSPGGGMASSNYPCSQATNIRVLEEINPARWDPAFDCNYSLGERLFLSLWKELDEASFVEGAQRLYAASAETPEGAGFPDMKAAFGQSPPLDRWYSGPRVSNLRPPGEAPTWKLDAINGTITGTGVALSQEGPLVQSFSARQSGIAYFHFEYEHPQFQEDPKSVGLTLVEGYEDGFAYEIQDYELVVEGIHVGGSWRLPVGPGDGAVWTAGGHWAILLDGTGNKVADAQWTVTP